MHIILKPHFYVVLLSSKWHNSIYVQDKVGKKKRTFHMTVNIGPDAISSKEHTPIKKQQIYTQFYTQNHMN